ncbi:AMP-binding protein [Streptomyces sp. SID7982]|nr:AMP-binding protein [Streptomyces sp. SID7982]
MLTAVQPLEPIELNLLDAQGCVLVEQVTVPVALPPFDNSSMDGYAVRAADTEKASDASPAVLTVIGDVAAGSSGTELTVGPGRAARIMTGAPMPPGADAVVPVEWTDGGTGGGPVRAMAPHSASPEGSGGQVRVHRAVTPQAHGNITYNAERQRTGSRIPEGSTYFALAPLFHITGMVAQFAACVLNGGTLALAHRFEPGAVLDAFAEHRPAYTVGPATAFMALAAHPAATRDHFSSFVLISSGGAPLPPALVEKFRAGFGPYLHNGYGLTECTAPCASVPPGREAPVDPASGTLAVGVPGPDSVVRVLDPEGHEVPFGEQGEIAVRGPQVVPGYWRRPKATAETFPGGELRTGDIGFMDRDGWLYVVDRKKDMINASGFKVWPREVEDVLHTHPAVREAAVVGAPDAYRGETVRAYVSLRAAVAPADLVAHCKERLAAYKYPREVRVLPELPKTSSGKILRRELRAPSGAGSGGTETEGRA